MSDTEELNTDWMKKMIADLKFLSSHDPKFAADPNIEKLLTKLTELVSQSEERKI